jgi:hypothetical protein
MGHVAGAPANFCKETSSKLLRIEPKNVAPRFRRFVACNEFADRQKFPSIDFAKFTKQVSAFFVFLDRRFDRSGAPRLARPGSASLELG